MWDSQKEVRPPYGEGKVRSLQPPLEACTAASQEDPKVVLKQDKRCCHVVLKDTQTDERQCVPRAAVANRGRALVNASEHHRLVGSAGRLRSHRDTARKIDEALLASAQRRCHEQAHELFDSRVVIFSGASSSMPFEALDRKR